VQGYLMKPEYSINIDTEDDWEKAERYFARNQKAAGQ
jgi:CMP-N-acetylneuraminic acid synthetase